MNVFIAVMIRSSLLCPSMALTPYQAWLARRLCRLSEYVRCPGRALARQIQGYVLLGCRRLLLQAK